MASNTIVELRDVTRDNWQACSRLRVADSQRHLVATNDNSLAMAAYEPNLSPRAIYNDESIMVGFIMYGWWEEKNAWWIARLMVDERYQGRGYARAAMEHVLSRLGQDHPNAAVGISFVPGNEPARALYTSLGFEATGEYAGDEIVFRRPCVPG